MANFRIPASTFLRFKNICSKPKDQHYKFIFSRGVNISVKCYFKNSSVTFITATNGKILCCEAIEFSNENLKVENVTININYVPENVDHIVVAGALVFGESKGIPVIFFDNAIIKDEFINIEKFLPREQTENLGNKFTMSFDIKHLNKMALTTKTGQLIFPKSYNLTSHSCIIVNEYGNENWFGLFLPLERLKNNVVSPATVPNWI